MARGNMGIARRVLEIEGDIITGGGSAKRANEDARENARNGDSFANAQYKADLEVRAAEAIMDKAVEKAHSARLAAYKAGLNEIEKQSAVEAAKVAQNAAMAAQVDLADSRNTGDPSFKTACIPDFIVNVERDALWRQQNPIPVVEFESKVSKVRRKLKALRAAKNTAQQSVN